MLPINIFFFHETAVVYTKILHNVSKFYKRISLLQIVNINFLQKIFKISTSYKSTRKWQIHNN